jgi:WD40 repeat protein
VYYAPDRTELYTVNGSGTITIHEPERGADQNSLTSGILFNGTTAYDNTNGWLALGGSDGNIQVWDVYNRTSLATFPAHTAPLNTLTFSADGTVLASAGQDGKVILWDWRNRVATQLFDVQSAGIISIALSPDMTQMTIAGVDYTEIYSLVSNQFLYTIAIGTNRASAVVQYSPDGKYIITGGTDVAEMSILEAQSGKIVAQLPQTMGERTSAIFSQEGDLLVTTVLDGGVNLWNVAQATEASIPSARLLVGSTRVVGSEWSQDGFTLAFFDASGVVFLWGIKE